MNFDNDYRLFGNPILRLGRGTVANELVLASVWDSLWGGFRRGFEPMMV